MIAKPQAGQIPQLQTHIARIVADYGWRRTAIALIATLGQRRERPPLAGDFSPHLRRDLGLPPAPARPDYWRHL